MSYIRSTFTFAIASALAFVVTANAIAGDLVETSKWMVAETVEVMGHSPHESIRLYDQGSIDALGFRPDGGDVYCYSIEIWMADGRRISVQDRSFRQGDVAEFDLDRANRTVDRIEYSCHPRFGVTTLTLEILVR